MPRTEVYQLRLTSDEKAALARRAEELGLSIAAMIRRDYQLGASFTATWNGETFKYRETTAVVGDPPALTKLVKQLEAQPGVTPEHARERARKRLGL